MAEVLVLTEHADGALKKVSAELITAARVLGEPVAVVVGAPGTAAPLVDGLKEAGAAKVYVAESDDAAGYLITPVVDVLASLVETATPAAVVLAANAGSKVTASTPKPPKTAGEKVTDEGDGGTKVAEYLVAQKII